jgi:hypothetical protein
MKRLINLVLVLSMLLFPMTVMAASGNTWHVPGDFATIQDAVNSPAVVAGDTIIVGSGNHAGALLTKSLEIKGKGQVVINSGPLHSSGLVQGFRLFSGSDGSSFSNLRFEVDLAIINADPVHDVTVSHNTFVNSIQAISAWRGSRWTISHNNIIDLRTRCGGGIGILIGDYGGGTVSDNVVSHNKISGTLHVSPTDCGGYQGTGLVIYADFRFGRVGTTATRDNYVTHNEVSLISDNPALVDVVAFELTDTRDNPNAVPYPVIFDNAIGFNDFRGTIMQISITPADLENHNSLSRNLGNNRGHGLHPSVFTP